MRWPPALRSKYNPSTPSNLIDYSIKAPLTSNPSNFPCKGYQNNTPLTVTTMYQSGSTYNMTLDGTADHGGGSCQLSLSYDNGKTFKVIKSIIGGCTEQPTYNFTVPSYAPSGIALFAWSWSNYMGNREFYMNCAVVHVMSSTNSKRSTQFDNLPNIWVADLSSVNNCTTDAANGSMDPVYPEPGPMVEYGGSMSASSPVTPGNCEVPAVQRVASPVFSLDISSSSALVASTTQSNAATASALNTVSLTSFITMTGTTTTTVPFSTASAVSGLTAASSSILLLSPTTTQSSVSTYGLIPLYVSSTATSNSTAAATPLYGASTTTVTMDCPATVTVTLQPSTYPAATYTISSEASACTGTAAICPCANDFQCMNIGDCTWECLPVASSMGPSFVTSTLPASASASSTTAAILSSTAAAPTTTLSSVTQPMSTSGPGFANVAALNSYLPCQPGTFICTDPTTWYTCAVEADGSYAYQYPRTVAAGMQCLPHLSAGSSIQQGNTPSGYYRDDQYVAASPYGSCSISGAIQCSNGGQGFQMCSNGAWVNMGSVAAGTQCVNGQIVGL